MADGSHVTRKLLPGEKLTRRLSNNLTKNRDPSRSDRIESRLRRRESVSHGSAHGEKKGKRGWKIEIKGRWVIAVAWEAARDKSNRSGNRNATPSSDHERKNPHGKSPGINSVPRLEPVFLIGSIPYRNVCSFFYPSFLYVSPLFTIFPYLRSLPPLSLTLGGYSLYATATLPRILNWKTACTSTNLAGSFASFHGRVTLGGGTSGHFDRDVRVCTANGDAERN